MGGALGEEAWMRRSTEVGPTEALRDALTCWRGICYSFGFASRANHGLPFPFACFLPQVADGSCRPVRRPRFLSRPSSATRQANHRFDSGEFWTRRIGLVRLVTDPSQTRHDSANPNPTRVFIDSSFFPVPDPRPRLEVT
ncbi:hypothetical protein H6P81_011172 [Aristolochia fimbriata]|uniref:Uncharacterized protein n=1 Tax=Aristolochia fimbriata TaxID=158543 RepID=A0AAV7EQR9_ARIFI|nr:hypothetical protein H6P81_011172 [Aristolochia fimbriata]